jgi:hypothetical protein
MCAAILKHRSLVARAVAAAAAMCHLGHACRSSLAAQERQSLAPSPCSIRLMPAEPRPSEDDNTVCLLERLFQGLSDGHEISQKDTDAIEASGGHVAYGELTIRGMRELLRLMQPCSTPSRMKSSVSQQAGEEVFYDLGSGRGASVVQAAIEWPVDRAVGVELAPSRDEVGRAALERARSSEDADLREACARVELRRGDMTACVGCEDATLVYVASLLFDDDFMLRLASRLAALPRVRCIASLRPFPAGSLGPSFVADLANSHADDDPCTLADRVEVTWGRARVYLYRREV